MLELINEPPCVDAGNSVNLGEGVNLLQHIQQRSLVQGHFWPITLRAGERLQLGISTSVIHQHAHVVVAEITVFAKHGHDELYHDSRLHITRDSLSFPRVKRCGAVRNVSLLVQTHAAYERDVRSKVSYGALSSQRKT